MSKSPINIVWFKRDLRFTDHEPLFRALEEDIPVLLIYFFEPLLIAFPDSDLRHWRFVHAQPKTKRCGKIMRVPACLTPPLRPRALGKRLAA